MNNDPFPTFTEMRQERSGNVDRFEAIGGELGNVISKLGRSTV